MTHAAIKCILFDFDGTLAKTMETHYHAWQESVRPYGIFLTEEEYYPLEGMPIPEIAKHFCKNYALNVAEIPQIIQRKKAYYLTHASPALYNGVEEVLAELKAKKIRLGIVTASVLEQLQSSVPPNFLEQFDVLITGEKTVRGKPFPDPYLMGLEELQLQPEECIVVENAPLGIQSAKNAGIYCIAVTHTVSKEKLQEADEIVSEVKNILKSKKL